MNNQWQSGTPKRDGIYIAAIFNIETGSYYHGFINVYNGECLLAMPFYIVGWMDAPVLPEKPKSTPIVEKITWYPFAICPEKQGTYLVKGIASDGVTIYDKLFYDGSRWPENDFTFWAKQD